MEHDEGNSKTVTSRHAGGKKGDRAPESASAEQTSASTPETLDAQPGSSADAAATGGTETPSPEATAATSSESPAASAAPVPAAATPGEESAGATEHGITDVVADGAKAGTTGIEAGQTLGPYVVTHVLAASDAPFVAVLDETQGEHGMTGLPGLHYLLVPLAAADVERAGALAALGLQHSRLLVPRAVVPAAGRDHLVVEILAELDGTAPQSVSAGARLGANEALRAGSGLADALAYLHRNGYAHGHIDPDTLFVRDGRAYLGGLEGATALASTSALAADAAREDANALARVLADLAGLAVPEGQAEARAGEDRAAQTGNLERLEQIAATGRVNGYTSPDEVAAACGQAIAPAREHAPEHGEAPEAAGPEVPQERFQLRIASATTVGMVRAENQDAVATMHFEVHDDLIGDMPAGVFLVADGMGGEAHGEVASRIAARIVTSEMARTFFAPLVAIPATVAAEEGADPFRPDEDLAAALVRAVTAANTQVRALSEYLNSATGTTLTALAMRGTQAVIAHLGDSRAYLWRAGDLRQLTEDHSLLARMEALDHPLLRDDSLLISRSILYRSLGQEDAAPPDVLDVALQAGDRLMLCSDGLWDDLKDDVIAGVMGESPDPQTCANELVRLANEAGGNDNSTALVLFVEPEPVDPAAAARMGQAEA